MTEREQVNALLKQVETPLRNLDGPGKGELETTLKKWQKEKRPSLEDVQAWHTTAQLWIQQNSKKEVPLVMMQQFIIFVLVYVVSIVFGSTLVQYYLIALPFILQIQGELVDKGVGQYVVLERRDVLDTFIRIVLLLFPILGVIALSKNKSLQYLVGVLVGSLVVMDAVGKYIVYYVAWFAQWFAESSLDEFQKGYVPHRYGWYTIHIPILVSVMAMLVVSFVVSTVKSYVEDSS